ncbi:family 20 glycosylhydrolase [Pendulispora brunnea]|uniref:beta-N-acetylhexosaminidase n=1 Tax=Pendulispora brunnea TaxID=2905690 RepID=A0ABZ2KB75_9BACT
MRTYLIGIWMGAACLGGCAAHTETNATDSANLEASRRGPNISITFRPLNNLASADGSFFLGSFTVRNDSTVRLGSSGWQIYFSYYPRNFLKDGEGNAQYKQHLAEQGVRLRKAASGDYFVLEPLDNFVPIEPGRERVIEFLAVSWTIHKSDAPSGFHIVFPPSTEAWALSSSVQMDPSDPKQTKRVAGDVVPVQTASLRYEENAALKKLRLEPGDALLPRPQSVTYGEGQYRLGGARIEIEHARGLAKEAAFLRAALGDVLTGVIDARERTARTPAIRLVLDPSIAGGPEGYALSIDPRNGVEIRGADTAGVFYGIQTLRQLVPVEPGKKLTVELPALSMTDAPLFPYRGMALDVARHFHSKAALEKLLDLLALHKINKLHLHLTDDEGWRLEIPGIPELTSYGATRGFDANEQRQLHVALGSSNGLRTGDGIRGKARTEAEANGGESPAYQGFERATLNFAGQGSGHYTVRDFEEILAYAAERHIDVIPEIDMPGHARAAVRAMEHRYAKYAAVDPVKAGQYRLVDPKDTSKHTTVQGYTDNFINPCLPSSYAFLSKVVRELKARFDAVPGAKLTMIHGGGDELPSLQSNVWWQGSPLCKSTPETSSLTDLQLRDVFLAKWQRIITATGATMTGWDDVLHDGFQLEGFVPMPWQNVWGRGKEDFAYRYANRGNKVILSHATNLYLDMAYNKDPDEPGLYWANFVDERKTFEYQPFDLFALGTHDRMGNPFDPHAWDRKERLTAAGRANILGMAGLLWGENVKTDELIEYYTFPKILGVAERAWNRDTPAPAEMPAAWERFVNTLGQAALPRLDFYRAVDLHHELPRAQGVNYRVPLPGGKIEQGQLLANVRYPTLTIEYSTDGVTFAEYTGPVAVRGSVWLRTRTRNGHVSRVAKIE